MADIHVTPIDAMAMAIFMFEGGRLAKPNVRCVRNNNPGNLRPYLESQEAEDNYRVFHSFMDGWIALCSDIKYKVEHHPEIRTMLDFLNKYAPAADGNSPTEYGRFVCHWLSDALGQEVTLSTPVRMVFD